MTKSVSGSSQKGKEVLYPSSFNDVFLTILKSLVPNPETRHLLLPLFARIVNFPGLRPIADPNLEKVLKFHDKSMPLTLASPVMLAAGGVRASNNLSAFQALGFGALTLGTATLNPLKGNTYRPRIRLINSDRAINNNMGLDNAGIDNIAELVNLSLGRCHRRKLSLGISVAHTPGIENNDDKIADTIACFRKAYRAADYVEINVSCPNTSKDRVDWQTHFFASVLSEIMDIRSSLAPRKAVFVKLSPDLSQGFLDSILQIVSDKGVTGLILFNTFPSAKSKYLGMYTLDDHILPVSSDGRKGGISGSVLFKNTLPAVRYIKQQLPNLSILASGGIDRGSRVLDLLEAGADAVQCYTVLAYRWNAIRKINRELLSTMSQRGYKSLADLST